MNTFIPFPLSFNFKILFLCSMNEAVQSNPHCYVATSRQYFKGSMRASAMANIESGSDCGVVPHVIKSKDSHGNTVFALKQSDTMHSRLLLLLTTEHGGASTSSTFTTHQVIVRLSFSDVSILQLCGEL